VIFRLAKIQRAEKLRQANNLRTLFGSLANAVNRFRDILLRLRLAPHLHERDAR
jgi:hypothetical protein